jgi:hypothetical protein
MDAIALILRAQETGLLSGEGAMGHAIYSA